MTRLKKMLLSCFILFNFLTMVRVLMPLNSLYFSTLYRPIDSYLSFFSIYQDWMLFAPNPSRHETYVTAKIEYVDGTSDIYTFEHSPDISLAQKYSFGERYRKFTSEALWKKENSFMWPDTAKFALRKVRERNFHKTPFKVHLTKHWAVMPRVQKKFWSHNFTNTSYEKFKFFTQEVI